jgi:hypothetical protein
VPKNLRGAQPEILISSRSNDKHSVEILPEFYKIKFQLAYPNNQFQYKYSAEFGQDDTNGVGVFLSEF